MHGGAKADGSALGGILYGALATHGVWRGAEIAPGNATSGMLTTSSGTLAMCSGAPAASSNAQTVSNDGMAATGKEAVPTVVLTDEAEEEGSEGQYLTDGEFSFPSLFVLFALSSRQC
ncbi:hypothetical protein VPH35_001667 [Triticum aestivum]